MLSYMVYCPQCGHKEQNDLAYKCPECGGVYDVRYRLDSAARLCDDTKPGLFRYEAMLPMLEGMECASLGEAGTPLIQSLRAGGEIGIPRLYFKNETVNPSGSFKDRALALAVNRAKALGMETVIAASAGNGSASAATYAARLGMKAVAVAPGDIPAPKMSQALALGAKAFKVPGEFSRSFAVAREAAEEHGLYNVTTTYINPYAREGYKTAAYELYEQMEELPDWVAVPIGVGPLLAGMLKGFEDLRERGLTKKIPRMIGVQTERYAPVATAFLNGVPAGEWHGTQPSIASGINDTLAGYADEGDYTVGCIKKSRGTAVIVAEENLARSVLMLASREGIYAEPAGAIGLWGVKQLAESGVIGPGETVVVMVTGHGLKNPVAQTAEAPVVETGGQLVERL